MQSLEIRHDNGIAALVRMLDDADRDLVALASLHTATLAGKSARVAIGGRWGERAAVELTTAAGLPNAAPAHAGVGDHA